MVRTWQVAAGSAAVGLTLAIGAVAASGPWDSGQRKAERDRAASQSLTGGADHGAPADAEAAQRPQAAPSAPGVLAALTAPAAPPGAPLEPVLRPLMADPALGRQRAASVVDVTTGKVLYADQAGRAQTPASTIKIATAVAVLAARGPEHRIPTRVLADPGGRRIVLTGGGDPTLTARTDRPGAASLHSLADDTAAALKGRPASELVLAYDESLYTGPARHPIGVNGNLAPVTALMVDEARLDGSLSGDRERSATPAADAARAFAGLLRARGIAVRGEPVPGRAAADAAPLAETLSPTVAALVERMLTHSDNDLAEALARQTALAGGLPASFDGAGRAVAARLGGLGADVRGARFADGSGLSRADRVSASLLTSLLVLAADPARPELRPVLTGLPVAGFTGTLTGRNTEGSASGLVRAKTGTLTGVNSLAGTAVSPTGRLLAFAFLASETTDRVRAPRALDHLAAALTTPPT
ncbi:D-alanyl-D-alanine carboxypeptidase/D-alanyl-D-alanine-endopeptidase [Streptomyces bambusae]|uniref:D-alanyl-D-alanine carboxypeptidase/D-alanyl-D-alanine endopeptidase n=1 Tax=Streptomyces bambusae TaxID=1550616 RepID=UPI001CFEFBEF|nr:D-alanyl-D-alanine carboxypeptidase/D-alanyl-D-alanine-endopeptidase [Streptomyces bambusae]MCB5166011.1 D-alanyl-D-alanine carboxypeptidase/D-alanyl-D-alanine-endopeptidase [Streptomyces bambusae]